MLEVQKYLKENSLESLSQEYGIKYKFDATSELVILTYSMINSQKTHPITRECRGLVLDVSSGDVVSMAYHRFFNYGEAEAGHDMDILKCTAVEKLDGSLISIFNHKGKWRIATRGVIDPEDLTPTEKYTFTELIHQCLPKDDAFKDFDENVIYLCEICSPDNRIVTMYKETELVITGARSKTDFSELDYGELESLAVVSSDDNKVRVAKTFDMIKLIELENINNERSAEFEGFVVVDYTERQNGHFNRFKFKNARYVALHHIRDQIGNNRAVLGLVISDDTEEVLLHFPELSHIIEGIRCKFLEHLCEVNEIESKVNFDCETRKDLAMQVKDSKVSAYLFWKASNRDSNYKGYLDEQIGRKSLKLVAKRMLPLLGIEDNDTEEAYED